MIYAIPIENYPKEGQFIEELSYKDENSLEWRIARIQNGFIVRYFGHDYFKDEEFHFEIGKKLICIKNTNCIFFESTDFELFCEMRDILQNGYTDEIWESIESFFKERFEADSNHFLASEIV